MIDQNLVEAANADIMRRVFEPRDDGIPDPGIDFAGCVDATMERIRRAVSPLTEQERRAYFVEKAMDVWAWCLVAKAPDALTHRVEAWLRRLTN